MHVWWMAFKIVCFPSLQAFGRSSGWLCKVYGFSSHVLPATGICQPVCPKNFVPQDVVQPDYYGWQLLSLGMTGSHFPTQRTNNNSCSIQKWIKMVIPPTWLIHPPGHARPECGQLVYRLFLGLTNAFEGLLSQELEGTKATFCILLLEPHV